MIICFVENLAERYDYSNFDLVVAVTPMAMHDLSLANIEFTRIDQLFPESLRSPEIEDKYFHDQSSLFKTIDNRIHELLKSDRYKNREFSFLYAYFLKVATDTVVYYSIIVKNVIELFKADSIEYHKKKDKSSIWGNNFEFSSTCLDRIISDLSRHYNYNYKLVGKYSTNKKVEKKRSLRIRIILRIRRYQFLYYGLEYLSAYRTLKKFYSISKIKVSTKLLFLQNGYDLKIPYSLMRRTNHIHRSIRQDKNIHIVRRFSIKKIQINSPNYKTKISWKKIAEELLKQEDLYLFNKIFDIKLPDFYKEIFVKFYNEILPDIVEYSDFWNEFYSKNKIDYVISANLFSIKDLTALSIAKMHHIETVGWNHGNSIFVSKMEEFGDFQFYTNYLVDSISQRNSIETNYQESHVPKNITVVGSTRLSSIHDRNRLKNTKRNKVLYIPGIMWGHEELFNTDDIRYTKYYDFQKKLVDQIKNIETTEFIFKLHCRDKGVNPISLFLKENNIHNIQVRYDKLSSYLDLALVAIVDYPSTALFEILQTNINIIYIHNSEYNVDHEMLNILRSNIIVIDNVRELAGKLRLIADSENFEAKKQNQNCLSELGYQYMDTKSIIKNFYQVISNEPLAS